MMCTLQYVDEDTVLEFTHMRDQISFEQLADMCTPECQNECDLGLEVTSLRSHAVLVAWV